MHRKVAGAVCVALALALAGVAGCGGDKPLTKAEFVRQVNAACKAPAPKTSTTSSRARGPEGFLAQILAQQQAVIHSLNDIQAPDGLNGEYATLKKAFKQRVAVIEKALAAVKADPKANLEHFGEDADAMKPQITRAVASLGVKDCA